MVGKDFEFTFKVMAYIEGDFNFTFVAEVKK